MNGYLVVSLLLFRFSARCRGHIRQSDDLGDPVVQIDLDGDVVAFGDRRLLIQHVGIGHWQCPRLSFFCFEGNRPLVLINAHDFAPAENGRRVTRRDDRANREEEAEC